MFLFSPLCSPSLPTIMAFRASELSILESAPWTELDPDPTWPPFIPVTLISAASFLTLLGAACNVEQIVSWISRSKRYCEHYIPADFQLVLEQTGFSVETLSSKIQTQTCVDFSGAQEYCNKSYNKWLLNIE